MTQWWPSFSEKKRKEKKGKERLKTKWERRGAVSRELDESSAGEGGGGERGLATVHAKSNEDTHTCTHTHKGHHCSAAGRLRETEWNSLGGNKRWQSTAAGTSGRS